MKRHLRTNPSLRSNPPTKRLTSLSLHLRLQPLHYTGFSSDLHDAGCCNVSSIDLSSVVIQQMADRYREKEEMEFTVMDATNLDFFPNECFDLVIDKGLTDAVLCGDKSFERVSSMISEMHRVLKRGGTYIVCCYGVPASRVTYLKKDTEWLDVEIKQIGTITRVWKLSRSLRMAQ